MAKTAEQNNTKGAMRKNIEQVLSTIIILVFDVKKKFSHKLLSSNIVQQSHAQPKRAKNICLRKIAHW